jgi:hypothetical protein
MDCCSYDWSTNWLNRSSYNNYLLFLCAIFFFEHVTAIMSGNCAINFHHNHFNKILVVFHYWKFWTDSEQSIHLPKNTTEYPHITQEYPQRTCEYPWKTEKQTEFFYFPETMTVCLPRIGPKRKTLDCCKNFIFNLEMLNKSKR